MQRVRALSEKLGRVLPAAALTAYSRAEDARRSIRSRGSNATWPSQWSPTCSSPKWPPSPDEGEPD